MANKIKVGCDPEVFVRNPNNLQFRCAHNMVPGTKHEPFRVPYGAVQVDGMALEFNINPVTKEDNFVRNVTKVYNKLGRMVPGYELVPVPTAQFSDEEYDEAPEEAKILGCEPDYNAYTKDPNPRPNGAVKFRTGSGHVHIGWTEDMDPFNPGHFEDCCRLVKALDRTLGIQSIEYDKDKKRRQLYGAPGAFRPKSYGVEYRVLSNAWLSSEELMRWVFRTTVKTVEHMDLYPNIAHQQNFGISDAMMKSCFAGKLEHRALAVKILDQYGFEAPPALKPVKMQKAA